MLSRMGFIIIFVLASNSFADYPDYCTKDNFLNISKLYEHKSHDTARIIFNILNCNGSLSKETKMKPYVALVGGLMRTNPDLIEDIYNSAQNVKNLDAPKIYLDGLWFCASEPCRAKLRTGPFSLPQKDVTALLKETPPDPYTFPIDSPASIDILWGYFTATGDSRIVQRIFDFVKANWQYYDAPNKIETERLSLIYSAKWSLVSMAAQHPLVKSVLEKSRVKSSEAVKLLAEVEKEILNKP